MTRPKRMRGRSEEVIGAWLRERGQGHRVIVATKALPPLTHDHILSAVEDSLRRLQIETIDLYQMHAWEANTPLEETLEALDAIVRQGKARYVACSNWDAGALAHALDLAETNGWARLQSVQPQYNLVVRDIEAELLPLCTERQMGVLSYSPLGGGFLTGKYRPGEPIPGGSRMDVVPGMQRYFFNERGFQIAERLQAKAAELGIASPLLALAWAMSNPAITSVLCGTRSTGQVDQAIAAEGLGMTPELRAELSAM